MSAELVGHGPEYSVDLFSMARDPFSPPRASGRGLKPPYVIVGLLLIALVTLALGFLMPLRTAQEKLAHAFETEGTEHAATREQLKKTTEQLQETQTERDELAGKVKTAEELAAATAERALDLHAQLKDKLAPQIKANLVTLTREGDASQITIDDLRLFRGHEVSVHPPGKKVLCGVAKVLSAIAATHSVTVQSHARLSAVGNTILRREYPTAWDVTAARASSAAQLLLACGLKSARFSAAAFADGQPSPEQNKKSSGELRIQVAPKG